MPTLAVGNNAAARPHALRRPGPAGFTLLELLMVLVILASTVAGVSLALRSPDDALTERDALRLAALLDAGRAQARASGMALRWQARADGFVLDQADGTQRRERWLGAQTQVLGSRTLLLGPEPLLPAQTLLLGQRQDAAPSTDDAGVAAQRWRIYSDGLRPFRVSGETP